MTGHLCMPRRGLADRSWPYRLAVDTDIAVTFAAERARLAATRQPVDAFAERAAVRAVIAESCDAAAAAGADA